jgi:hypothetical protein
MEDAGKKEEENGGSENVGDGERDQQTRKRRLNSVGTILGIDSPRLDSFGDFCGRARRLDSKVKESIPLPESAKKRLKPRVLAFVHRKIALKNFVLD